MKILLGMVIAASLAGSAQADVCTLSQDDVTALAASPSKLTPQAFSALDAVHQQMVCDTRAFVRQIAAQNGVITTLPSYAIKYLSPPENTEVIKVSNCYMSNLLQSKPAGTAC